MLCTLFNRLDTPKIAPSRGNIYTPPMWYMFPGPTRLCVPNCISIGSAVFAQLTAESPYIFTRVRLNAINALLETNRFD